MPALTKRHLLQSATAGLSAAALNGAGLSMLAPMLTSTDAAAANGPIALPAGPPYLPPITPARSRAHPWARGIEGQRCADLGNGRYLNPIISGDHADPTVLKDGDDYYLTYSSMYAYPGVVIHHSKDLVNWTPICAAVTEYIGTIWAMDLVKHNGRYYIYIPALKPDKMGVYVIHADNITGPWSDPIDLNIIGAIDPGHAVGEDGKRYLFLNGVRRIQLADDGLSTIGALEHAFDPWAYPPEWDVEMFAPEGPKIFRRGGYFYMVYAVGGTSGPATSHMVTLARSTSINGPWEHCPHNPIVRTVSESEPWWSRGHASMFEGPRGDWWMIYHGYENGYRTLGRQTLLEPMVWDNQGWPRARGGDLSRPIQKPINLPNQQNGRALSDDFSTNKFGANWGFFKPGPDEMARVHYDGDGMVLSAKGQSLADTTPLTLSIGERAYSAEIDLEIIGDAQVGMGLYYSEKMFVGVGFTPTQKHTYNYGEEMAWMLANLATRRLKIKLVNHHHNVRIYHQHEGGAWVDHGWGMETSGMNHNVFGNFLSLKLAIFAAGNGAARLRNFRFQAL